MSAYKYKLKHKFSHNGQKVENYINRVCNQSIDFYHNFYYKHPELTVSFDQDVAAFV